MTTTTDITQDEANTKDICDLHVPWGQYPTCTVLDCDEQGRYSYVKGPVVQVGHYRHAPTITMCERHVDFTIGMMVTSHLPSAEFYCEHASGDYVNEEHVHCDCNCDGCQDGLHIGIGVA